MKLQGRNNDGFIKTLRLDRVGLGGKNTVKMWMQGHGKLVSAQIALAGRNDGYFFVNAL